MYFFDRENVESQTLRNLVESGEILPTNAQSALQAMKELSPKDLLTVLMESHMLKEERGKSCYYVEIKDICLN